MSAAEAKTANLSLLMRSSSRAMPSGYAIDRDVEGELTTEGLSLLLVSA